jgi:SAM-dependent methyltransferase
MMPGRRCQAVDVPERPASINFDRLAAVYEDTRGGLVRGSASARSIVPYLRPGAVLEIGIGTGSVALPLTELGRCVVGIDLSPNMLALAHERLGARVAIGDVMALPVATQSVRNVVGVWVFQVVGSVETTLREARRVLQEGGRLVIITSRGKLDPDDIDEVSVDFQTVIRGMRQDHPDNLITLGRACGLRLVEHRDTEAQSFEQSPSQVADQIEARGYGILLDLGDDDWQRVVAPVVAAMRGLPDPDRPRLRVARHDLLVFDAV